MNDSQLGIIVAKEKGYYVDDKGNVFNKNNRQRKLNKINEYYAFNVRLCNPRRNVSILVHRLQAYQKFGDKIFGKNIHVRHLDGNPRNNSKNNIAFGSVSDNIMDMSKTVRIQKAKYAVSQTKTYISDEIKRNMLKDYYENNLSYKDLMIKYDINSKGTISYIISKKAKRRSLQNR